MKFNAKGRSRTFEVDDQVKGKGFGANFGATMLNAGA
jgi:hypothetical protein